MVELGRRRTVLVLEEQAARSTYWIADLERQFEVKRVASVIGAHRTLQDGVLAAAVLHISSPETRAVPLVRLLRGQPGLDHVPLFLLVPNPIEAVQRALMGLAMVEVLDVARAHLTLRATITGFAGAPRRDEHRRLEPRTRPTQTAVSQARTEQHGEVYRRFLTDSATRAARALNLCDDLRTPGHTPAQRRVLTRELRDLLGAIRSDSSSLHLTALTDLLTDAERVVNGMDTQRNALVPRGVLGLLGDLVQLANADASISEIDVELHRTRLAAASPARARRS